MTHPGDPFGLAADRDISHSAHLQAVVYLIRETAAEEIIAE